MHDVDNCAFIERANTKSSLPTTTTKFYLDSPNQKKGHNGLWTFLPLELEHIKLRDNTKSWLQWEMFPHMLVSIKSAGLAGEDAPSCRLNPVDSACKTTRTMFHVFPMEASHQNVQNFYAIAKKQSQSVHTPTHKHDIGQKGLHYNQRCCVCFKTLQVYSWNLLHIKINSYFQLDESVCF